MAYAHFEDIDEVVISTKIGSQPEELADFILGSVVQSHLTEVRKRKNLKTHSKSISELTSLTSHSLENGHGVHNNNLSLEVDEPEDITPIEVHSRALQILQKTMELLQRNQNALQRGVEMTHLHTPEIMKRYGSTTSPRMNQRKEFNKISDN